MNLLEKCNNCKLKECIECEYTWSDLKKTIEEFEKDYISKDKIREKIEAWEPKLEETDKKEEEAQTLEGRVVLKCIGIRIDERIKTLQDLLKED